MGGGFTLAEVLITLAVIGIVAAITIPSIVVQNQKTELETRFTKAYSILMQMVNLSAADNGSIENWDWKEKFLSEEKDNFVKTYFLPYLNVAKFCPAQTQSRGCFPDVTYKYRNGTNYRKLVGLSEPCIVLADGSSVMFRFTNDYLNKNTKAIDLYTDINGQKKPNKLGRDLHFFSFYPQTGEFFPYGIYENGTFDKETNSFKRISIELLRNDCKDKGWYCSALIVIDGFKINY